MVEVSISIAEFISDTESHLAWAKAVAEKYTDTTVGHLPDGRWVFMSGAAAADATDVEFVASENGEAVYVCHCVSVGGAKVYSDGWPRPLAWAALEKLKKANPEAYAALVAAAKAAR